YSEIHRREHRQRDPHVRPHTPGILSNCRHRGTTTAESGILMKPVVTRLDIAHHRLRNQHIARAAFKTPGDVVAWLGAVQAQDFAGSKWAIGLRLRGATEADVDRAFADGSILRTHVMRPTWHYVAPADIRWLLALTAPRVHAANAFMYRKLELGAAVFKRSDA